MAQYTDVEDQGLIRLNIGTPGKTLLKKTGDIISQSTKALLESGNVDCLQYGRPTRGHPETLDELAKFLTDVYEDKVNSQNLLINSGATQGMMFVCQSLFNAGDLVLLEDPTYYAAIRILTKDLDLKCKAVPTDDDGINVDELDRILTEHIANKKVTSSKPYVALVYLVPTFNNPKGTILSEEKSKKLIKVLRKHKVLALCDDVYNSLSFIDEKTPLVTPPPKRLFAYDNEADSDYQGNVVSNGSFSKILGPGLRLGWIEAPRRLLSFLEASEYLSGGGCFNHYTSCVIREAMKLGLVFKHINEVREVYQARMNALCDALDQFIPMAKYTRPKGGFFVWVVLPEHIHTRDVLTACKEKYKIEFRLGNHCSCVENFQNCMRLSVSYYPQEILRETVRKIGIVVSDIVKAHDCTWIHGKKG